MTDHSHAAAPRRTFTFNPDWPDSLAVLNLSAEAELLLYRSLALCARLESPWIHTLHHPQLCRGLPGGGLDAIEELIETRLWAQWQGDYWLVFTPSDAGDI